MTLLEAISRAREFARVTETSHTDAQVMNAINEGVKEFAKEAKGITKEAYLDIEPMFDTRTTFAIRLTITGGTNALAATDIAITSTERDNATGTTVASDLQAAIQAAGAASATVAWSTTSWVFTVDSLDGTEVTVEEPSGIIYSDARALLFGAASSTQSGNDWVGSLPEDCLVETALPSDYRAIVPPVEWDKNKLYSANFDIFASPQQSSTHPVYYGIRNNRIRLWPSPSEQKDFHIWYHYIPTAFTQGYQECGLTGKYSGTATGLAATTAYTFKVAVDGAAAVQYTITTASTVTYLAVIALLNAQTQTAGATFSLVNGDLRVTSTTMGTGSSIALSAPASGTSLWTTIGATTFDTAVAGAGGTTIDIPSPYEMGPVYYAASMLAEQMHEYKIADRMFAQFRKMTSDFNVTKANDSPKMARVRDITPLPKVVV